MNCAACRKQVGNECLRLRIAKNVILHLCSRHCLKSWLASHPDTSDEWGPE